METVKLPPNAVEAEKAILGALFLDGGLIEEVDRKMSPDDFYRETHQTIYKAMLALAERREPLDFVTVINELKSRNMLSDVGGGEYLTELVDFVPTEHNMSFYIAIVKNKSISRKLIKYATDIVTKSYNNEPVENVLDFAKKSLSLIKIGSAGPMPSHKMIKLPNYACVIPKEISHVFADNLGPMAIPTVIVGMRSGREFAYEVNTEDEAKKQVDGILTAISIMLGNSSIAP